MTRALASLALLMVFCLAGCNGTPIGEDPKANAEVKYEYVAVLANFHRIMIIDPDGTVRVEQQSSKDPKDIIGARGQLTDLQRRELQQAARGWKSLKNAYPTDFGTILSITYDGHEVTSTPGEKTPRQMLTMQAVLDRIGIETLRAAGKLPPASPACASRQTCQ